MTEADRPKQAFFGFQSEDSSRPAWPRPGRPESRLPTLEPGTGCVTIIPPGNRRRWSAAWAADQTAEHVDWFDAETFRAVAIWATSKAPVIYLRESTGELTHLPLPLVDLD
ncbi:hypothetical protein [Amycolatopsis plumensis]|uniref:S9 family peptidase n=1 Tax=Amycolatopsis plumensis TaxID=236508 RepID=A0ABV5TUJ5_9PSEU